MKCELMRPLKPDARFVDLLTMDQRATLALVSLVFLCEFGSNADPEKALDAITEAIAEEDHLMGNA